VVCIRETMVLTPASIPPVLFSIEWSFWTWIWWFRFWSSLALTVCCKVLIWRASWSRANGNSRFGIADGGFQQHRVLSRHQVQLWDTPIQTCDYLPAFLTWRANVAALPHKQTRGQRCPYRAGDQAQKAMLENHLRRHLQELDPRE
jgi:hypothetical protein